MFSKLFILCLIKTFVYGDHHGSSYVSVSNHVVPDYHHHQIDEGHHDYEQSYDHHQEKHYPDHHPKYDYKYGVEDHHTKDVHSAQEHRDGDQVKGVYTVHQPDGKIRIVHYTSDKHNGFQAHVSYSGH